MSGRRARRRDARLVPVAAAAWIAAAWATAQPAQAGVVALVLWMAAVLAVAVAIVAARGRPGMGMRLAPGIAAVVLACAAGVCTHVAAAEPARTAAADLPTAGGRALTIEATAVGKIERSATGWRFDARLDELRVGDTRFTQPVPLVIRTAEVPVGLDLGGRLRLNATAWQPDAGSREVLVVDATAVPELLASPTGVLGAAAALRRGLVALTADLPPPGGGLIAGLAVGDTGAVTPELDAEMKASSLSHLTAVSGANCALVVGIAYALAALCGLRRGIRVAAGLGALIAFVVLVSPEPSVVRAAAMAAIAMLGLLLGRTGAGLSLLTASVAILLIADPWLAVSLGFALSVAATGALLVLAGPLAEGLGRWMPAPLALLISVPLAAQLACGPLIVLITPTVSVLGVLANILAAPAAPLGTVIGLAACLSAGIPYLGSGLAALAWLPAAWIAATAGEIARLPGATLAWPQGEMGLIALGVVGAAVAVLIVGARRWARVTAVLVLAASVTTALATGPVADAVARAAVPSEWAIAACDVGQGDAVLVRSGDAVLLIDTGPDPEPLAHCLRQLGVERIDLLVLTHFDLDHRGGVHAVLGRTDAVLHGPVDGAEDEQGLRELADGGARVTAAVRGMSGTIGTAHWRVLWPRADTPPGNDASVVVEITGGGLPSGIYLGDLSAAGQQAMAGGAVLRSGYAVVKVAHHGSADQDPRLYERLAPALALVSVGENDYGHPRRETLDLLAALGVRTARTDQDGLVVVWADAAGIHFWRERAPAAVAPGG
ncbi:ComEC/Rec2 family competence protein [Microbacterium sp.]|uniref:ComEC/Rec2 family competence protein n=1 Tax=Microbacterium sp. TaxID=51671 RepID=UPI0028968F22|nr:ComEC/Rec2 family competence protein [Microbacterium sp.]